MLWRELESGKSGLGGNEVEEQIAPLQHQIETVQTSEFCEARGKAEYFKESKVASHLAPRGTHLVQHTILSIVRETELAEKCYLVRGQTFN